MTNNEDSQNSTEEALIKNLLFSASDNATALLMPDATTLTYAQMREEVFRLSDQLRLLGIGAPDRVGIILPNGPHMAITFLAVAITACAAPLNPKYRAAEIEFYLDDLNASALITEPGDNSNLPNLDGSITHLTLDGSPGGLTLAAKATTKSNSKSQPSEDDAALILHTSGTTSRPKLVPLKQRQLVQSANNIADSLALTNADRSLNVMPLFHIHGLLAGLLAPLAAGGSVVATEGFDAFKFFTQLDSFLPTYYTAVPTMHQMVIARSSSYRKNASSSSLRFVRSSSASLPTPVLSELSELFEVPVIEAYGMTEAAHQMCSNPLPPRESKPGSVGLPTGIDLCILSEDEDQMNSYERGEVAIKGPSVIDGYENNEQANCESFASGWFRTGDEGYIDSDGYVFLTGRLKEQINRGGEKISPLEVDSILLKHEQVTQAVTFAIPHTKLGEDVAAAVVLSPNSSLSERDLRDHVAEHLAAFKVPKQILFLDELPKGPTGKLQRIGLASRLGLES